MRKIVKWGFRLGIIAIIGAVLTGIWKKEEIMRLMAVNSLFSEGKIVTNFSSMNNAFLSVEVPRGTGPVSDIPTGPQMQLPAGAKAWIAERDVTSLLVLKDGQQVFEAYYHDTTAADRRISWSVAKSFLSALFGVLLNEGTIENIDDPVTKYAPTLIGSAYENASIRDVLQMSSGVTFNEDYLDYYSDINRMGRTLALGGSMDDFTTGLVDTDLPPGSIWNYVSIDTHVIGMVIRGATGRDIASLLSEKIIAPLGLEQSPYYLTDGEKVAFVLGGLNLTTRDYARFAQMVLQDGSYGGVQIVPSQWIRDSTISSAPISAGDLGYGYQWWSPTDAREGEFFGHGIYGQYIYIDRPRGVVIVRTAADRLFRNDGVTEQNIDMFRQIAEAL
jgi:CubicO group peptidase (beta-lactamase class C family)